MGVVARPLSRLRLQPRAIQTGERSTTEPRYVDLRDHRGPMRKNNRTGPRRIAPADLEGPAQLREVRFFGSPAFRRLWASQVLSSLGDWIGLIAISAIAYRVAKSGGLSLVLAVRLGMAFFVAPFAGVLIDRVSRKRIMVLADIGRFATLCALPFVDTLWGLVLASVALEILTLLWAPAKEASVPNLVRRSFLPTANSLSIAASYGTFPFAAGTFAILAKLPEWLGQSEHLQSLHLTEESIALYFDAFTYLASAAVIATLALPFSHRENTPAEEKGHASFQQAIEGLQFVRRNPRVRAVVFGLAAGLIGGGSIVPLGPPFAADVLHAGSSGYGLLLTAMGTGMAIGVVGITLFSKQIPVDRVFVLAIGVSGVALGCAASMDGLGAAAACIAILGLCAGTIYVLGFTNLQANVDDEIRGRVFATFYTLTRVCIFLALILAAPIAKLLDKLSQSLVNGSVEFAGRDFQLQGVRITLWLGAFIILASGVFVLRSLRSSRASLAND